MTYLYIIGVKKHIEQRCSDLGISTRDIRMLTKVSDIQGLLNTKNNLTFCVMGKYYELDDFVTIFNIMNYDLKGNMINVDEALEWIKQNGSY